MAFRVLTHSIHSGSSFGVINFHEIRSFTTTLSRLSETTEQNALSYKVCRTPSNQLPIYHLSKNGGNKKITRIRKVEGNVKALRNDLQKALNLNDKECTMNSLTGHVIVKGHRKQDIIDFLTERKF